MIDLIRQIPTPDELKSEYPVSDAFKVARLDAVNIIRNILSGKDKRKLFIVGPCSADDKDAVIEYAVKLGEIAARVKDKLYTVVRVHTAKPRTRGNGYMGMLFSPRKNGPVDIINGIKAVRDIHIGVALKSGLFTSDELLYPEVLPYIDDLVSYLTVGARTCDDPTHRFVASGTDVPVGIKNPLNGNLEDLYYSVLTAKTPNEFLFGAHQVRTRGNPFAHAVLRGKVDSDGNHISNYSLADITRYGELGGDCSIIVDAGHSNSGKIALKQCDTVMSVLECLASERRANRAVKGFIVESYILGGAGDKYGMSVTDECLDLETTKELMLAAAQKITV